MSFSKHTILYVSPLWTGIKRFMYTGDLVYEGMPGFCKVFTKFLDSEEVEKVIVVFFTSDEKRAINIPKEYREKLEVHVINYTSMLGLFTQIPSVVGRIKKLVRDKAISVIYGQGSVGIIGGHVARSLGVRFFQRVYGSFLISEIDKSKWWVFMRHPLEYLSFSQRSEGTIISNDGTRGNKVFRWLNPKGELHFIINGVNKTPKFQEPNFQLENRFVSYIARVDNWKRQHLLILAIANLKENHDLQIPAYIVGDVITESYGDKLKALVKEHGVENLIHFTGGIMAAEAAYIMKHSELTCSLYHTSNLGNVFLEALSIGTPVVAINCGGSLDEIPETAYISVQEDVESISQGLLSHWNNESSKEQIKDSALKFADTNLKSWEERIDLEYDLILNKG